MLRILPAYWVCIFLTSALVGWWYLKAAWNPLVWVGAPTWDGFAPNPSDLVNGSIWTLPVEIACYIMLALIPGRALRMLTPILAVGFVVWIMTSGLPLRAWQPLVVAFATGLLLSTWRVPLRGPVALAGIVVAFVTVGSMLGTFVAAAGLVYALLWVGMRLPLRWTTDLSYGTYIYAFPVTQLLVLAGVASFGPLVLSMIAALATLAIAATSWFLIERPALSLKSFGDAKPWRAASVTVEGVQIGS
jgi:peptidoglycan/LPS O-acetylase OafA/YrhL